MEELAYKPAQKVSNVYTGGGLQPPKFMPSMLEYIRFKGKRQVYDVAAGAGGVHALGTIPEGYTFFITAVSVGTISTTAATKGYMIYVSGFQIVKFYGYGVNVHDNFQQSYAWPIEIYQNEQLQFYCAANTAADVTVQGFLVKNSDIPQF